MHRPLVLSALAAAIVTIPALASAGGNPGASHQTIGSLIAGHDGGSIGDYWTQARMAGARDLTVLSLEGARLPAADTAGQAG